MAELADAVTNGAFILDVREPEEFDDAHVPGAVPMPMATIASRLSEIPTDQQVLVICAVGSRSAYAGAFLVDQGIDAVNVAGGTRAWLMGGGAVERGRTASG